jgi:hypothetical protein
VTQSFDDFVEYGADDLLCAALISWRGARAVSHQVAKAEVNSFRMRGIAHLLQVSHCAGTGNALQRKHQRALHSDYKIGGMLFR